MPKIKIPRKSTIVDMTAMCDVAFLLLTFFILTAKFKPQAVVAVDVPFARTTKAVDKAIIITVNKEGKTFFSLKEKSERTETLKTLLEISGGHYPGIENLSENQKEFFALSETWGTPIEDFKRVASMNGTEFKQYQEKVMPGIPFDSLNNQIGDWVNAARYATNGAIKIGIKADKNAGVDYVKAVIKRLTEKDIHRFVLITTLAGTEEEETAETAVVPEK